MLVGYHAVFDADFLDALRFAADNAFGYVQFDLNVPRFYLDAMSPREADRIRSSATDKGVTLSFHAPGDNVSLFTDFPAAREGLIRQMQLILERANDLGARHLTVHPGSPPSFRKAGEGADAFRSEYRSYYARVLADNLRQIAERAGSVLICVENVGTLDLAFDALEAVLGKRLPLYLCWDLAKSQSQPAVEPFYRAHLAELREVHVHDIDSQGRGHAVVGQGTIDFRRYADIVERVDVATTIEVRPREAALESRRVLERILG